jgi:hypothetical protein
VIGRREIPLPRQAVANAASRARHVKAPRPRHEHEDVLRVVPVEAPKALPLETRRRYEMTPATTAHLCR